MTNSAIKSFTDSWLAAWTGNKPELLLTFYTDDAFYLDPANPDGIKGKDAIRNYFVKLLKKNPEWKWSAVEIFPTEKGITLKWKAEIPLPNKKITLFGLDIVEITADKVSRNEVYFDRHEWITALLANTYENKMQ